MNSKENACKYYKKEYGLKICRDNADKYLPNTMEIVTNCAEYGMLENVVDNGQSD